MQNPSFDMKKDEEMKKYTLNEASIILYGAASIGSIIYDNCVKNGLLPVAFIDKRGQEIAEFKGLPVYSTEDIEKGLIDKEVVIVVSIKNVFEHSEIAAWFFDNGYKKIVFRPFASIKGFGNEEENELNRVYDLLINDTEMLFNVPIPIVNEINHIQYVENAYIKSVEEGRVVAYIPIELVFTDLPKNGVNTGWDDIPIVSLISHVDFFRWLSGDEKVNFKHYLEYCEASAIRGGVIKVTKAWKENVLRNRADVYENMNNSLQRDFGFFINNAAYASYNDKGYFNLESGKHRAAFFVAKRFRYIPLSIKKDDYMQWISNSCFNEKIGFCKKQHILNTNAPIEFPYFFEVPCKSGSVFFELLCLVVHEISELLLNIYKKVQLSLFCATICLDDNGYFSRCLSRYGVVCVNRNSTKLSELFSECRQEERKEETRYHLLICDMEIKNDSPDDEENIDLALLFEKDMDSVTDIVGLSLISDIKMIFCGKLRRIRFLRRDEVQLGE